MLPASAMAQKNTERPGGLFGLYNRSGTSLLQRTEEEEEELDLDVEIQSFEEAPLGSGIVILLVAGLGYVALKKKEDEQ